MERTQHSAALDMFRPPRAGWERAALQGTGSAGARPQARAWRRVGVVVLATAFGNVMVTFTGVVVGAGVVGAGVVGAGVVEGAARAQHASGCCASLPCKQSTAANVTERRFPPYLVGSTSGDSTFVPDTRSALCSEAHAHAQLGHSSDPLESLAGRKSHTPQSKQAEGHLRWRARGSARASQAR